jgi:4-hydroxy-tetrahydrodipicolinate synthase
MLWLLTDMKTWEGIFTIMLTPFTKDSKVDAIAMKQSIDFVIDHGVHGLVFLGSTGEFPYIQMRDKKRIVDIAVEVTNGKLPVIIGTSAYGLEDVLELSKYSQNAGADGLMIAVPIYYQLSIASILKHYETIASKIDLPIILYNFPATTHLELTPNIVIKLAEIDNVIGIKESIRDLQQVKAVIQGVKKPFSTFVGGSTFLLDALKMGGAGAADPLANLLPEYVVAVYNAFQEGNLLKAEEAKKKLDSLRSITASASNAIHAAIKEGMKARGISMGSIVKPPLPQLTQHQKIQIQESVKAAGLMNTI